MFLFFLELELLSLRIFSDICLLFGECSILEGIMNFVRNDIFSELYGRLKKNNVLSVVDSVFGVLVIIGLLGFRFKDIYFGGSKDERVIIVGLMFGR